MGAGIRLAVESGLLSSATHSEPVTEEDSDGGKLSGSFLDIEEEEYVPSYQFERESDKIFKLKKQFYDQRREYNKLMTQDARWDNLIGKMKHSADHLSQVKPLFFNVNKKFNEKDITDCEGVLFLTDWHVGLTAENIWNSYNTDVLEQRLFKLKEKTIKYIKRHNPSVLHVAIMGDMVAGAIHVSARVQSEEDTCDQLMRVSEYLSEFVNELSNYVPKIEVYSTYGNHGRTVQNFKDSVHSDNMEKIIPWWMKQRLKGNDAITIKDNAIHEFVLVPVYDRNIVVVHGDLDRKSSSASTIYRLFSAKFNVNVHYIASGHIHHVECEEELGLEEITVGSICGTDEYANGKRLYSTPSQTLVFFGSDGEKDGHYDISLANRKVY